MSKYMGVVIFDLRETLITTMLTEDNSNTIVGGERTVQLINRLQELGVFVAICTGDGKAHFEETAQFFNREGLNISIDQMYNFDCLQHNYPGKTFSYDDDEYKEAIWSVIDGAQKSKYTDEQGRVLTVTFKRLKDRQELNSQNWLELETGVIQNGYTRQHLEQKAWEIFLTQTEGKSKPDIYLEILKIEDFDQDYRDNLNVMVFDDGFEQKQRTMYVRAIEYGFAEAQLVAVNSLDAGTLLNPLKALVEQFERALQASEASGCDVLEQTGRAVVESPLSPPAVVLPKLPKLVTQPKRPQHPQAVLVGVPADGEQDSHEGLKQFADKLIELIEAHEWHLGSFICLFHGGIDIKTQDGGILRVPHRVGGIHDLLKKVQDQQQVGTPEKVVEEIKQLLNTAVLKPKLGRDKDTTNFYIKLKEKVQKNNFTTEWMDEWLSDASNRNSGQNKGPVATTLV